MAIIYSYSKTNEAYGSDLLVLSRFQGGAHADNGRNYSIDIATLASFIGNNYSPTLNDVLNSGNISLLDAKIGSLYLYDTTNSAYAKIVGDQNRVKFYGIDDTYYGYIGRDSLFLSNVANTNGLVIRKTPSQTGSQTATFQDASGTVAYLTDIPSTSNYGLTSLIGDAIAVTNTTTEENLVYGQIAGTFTVFANTFAIGDSFKASLVGELSCLNNATLTIYVKTLSGTVLAQTGAMTLATTTARHWTLDINFNVRLVGAASTASIASGGTFTYVRNSGTTIEGTTFLDVNSTTFDTTIDNTLVITAQWGAASASNSIQTRVFTLNKVY